MDPNLFHLDWERTFEVLSGIVLAAFLVERFLSVLFENRALLPLFSGSGLKELAAFAASFAVCYYTNFDAVSIIFLRGSTGIPGEIMTAGVIAGGTKASVKLFRDVLMFRSTAYQEYSALRDQGHDPGQAARITAGKPKPGDAAGGKEPPPAPLVG